MTRTEHNNRELSVTLLTGFLGAGKTTILNKYLASAAGAGTAVLVNEFGDVDVDGTIIGATSGGGQMVSLPNGCVCCEMQDDLSAALLELEARRDADGGISRCIIETSGLADPGSILRTVGRDPRLKAGFKVAQTICVAAAPSILDQVTRFVEAAEQIALADRIVISKSDLVADDVVNEINSVLSSRNPLAEFAIMDIEAGVEALFMPLPKPGLARHRSLLDDGCAHDHQHGCDHHHSHHHGHDHGHDHDHSHDHTHGIASFSIQLDSPLDQDVFRDVLSFWIMRHSEALLRVKGFLSFAEEAETQLVNIVHDVCSIEPLGGEARGSFLVFIGIGLPENEIRRDLERCAI